MQQNDTYWIYIEPLYIINPASVYTAAGQHMLGVKEEVNRISATSDNYFKIVNLGTPWVENWQLFVRSDFNAGEYDGRDVILNLSFATHPGGRGFAAVATFRQIKGYIDAVIDASDTAPYDIRFTQITTIAGTQSITHDYLGFVRFYSDITNSAGIYSGKKLTSGTKIGDLTATDDEGDNVSVSLIAARAGSQTTKTKLSDPSLFEVISNPSTSTSSVSQNGNPFIILNNALYVKSNLTDIQYNIIRDNSEFSVDIMASDENGNSHIETLTFQKGPQTNNNNHAHSFLSILSGLRFNNENYEGLNDKYHGTDADAYLPNNLRTGEVEEDAQQKIRVSYSFLNNADRTDVSQLVGIQNLSDNFHSFNNVEKRAVSDIFEKIENIAIFAIEL